MLSLVSVIMCIIVVYCLTKIYKMTKFKTFKIDLSPEDEAILREIKKETGAPISWQMSQAIKDYINNLKSKENGRV